MWNLRETTSVKPWWNLPRNLVTAQDGSVPENQRESKSNSAPKPLLWLKTPKLLLLGKKHQNSQGSATKTMWINNLTKHHPFSPGASVFSQGALMIPKMAPRPSLLLLPLPPPPGCPARWHKKRGKTTTTMLFPYKAWVKPPWFQSWFSAAKSTTTSIYGCHVRTTPAAIPESSSYVCIVCMARPQDLGIEIEQKVWIWTNLVREVVVETGFYATLQASMSCARLATVLHPNSTDSSKCRSHCSKHHNLDARSRPISKTRHWEKKIENLSTWICSHLQVPN